MASSLYRSRSKLADYMDLVMAKHSLFSFSFTVAAFLVASGIVGQGIARSGTAGSGNVESGAAALSAISGGAFSVSRFLLVALAFLAGRTAANALNRAIDSEIDAKNPRTKGRHIPMGLVSRAEAFGLAFASYAVFSLAAALISPLCLILSPLAGFAFLLYSLAKRFTWLSHFILGAACAAAPAGAWIAVRGYLPVEALILCAANAAWVAAFDILYAIEDIAFDRAKGLHSVPAWLGEGAARFLALGLFCGATFLLSAFAFLALPSYPFLAGVGAFSCFALAQVPARARSEGTYRMNIYASLSILGGVLVEFALSAGGIEWTL